MQYSWDNIPLLVSGAIHHKLQDCKQLHDLMNALCVISFMCHKKKKHFQTMMIIHLLVSLYSDHA